MPDLFFPEAGNILWEEIRLGELEWPAAEEISRALLKARKTPLRGGA